jgi:hypothetical protein
LMVDGFPFVSLAPRLRAWMPKSTKPTFALANVGFRRNLESVLGIASHVALRHWREPTGADCGAHVALADRNFGHRVVHRRLIN